MKEARWNHSAIVYKHKLFVFGGCSKDGPLNTVEMCSPSTNKFVKMAPMKFPRTDFTSCRVGNLVYVVGGWILGSDNTKSVEVYNLDTNIWSDGGDFPGYENVKLYACAVNDKL